MAEHGTFYWNELMTADPEAAAAFFGKLVGWEVDKMTMPEGEYRVMKLGGKPAGGIMGRPPGVPDHVPPHWLSYLAVSDVDAACATTMAEGGKTIRPPFDVPGVGRIAIIADPTGAVLGIITPVPRPG